MQNADFPQNYLEGHRNWLEGLSETESSLYQKLGREGQTPSVMAVTCCDSRIMLPDIFNAGPGEFFVLRNIANLVPPQGQDNGMAAAVEFGVNAFKVQHIIVMGHASCGGVAASAAHFEAGNPSDGSLTLSWLSTLKPAYEASKAKTGGDDKDFSTTFEKQAVKMSLDNLSAYAPVEAAVKEGRLSLHGFWFDIEAARLNYLDAASDSFIPV
ncbi:hypothetical protein IMCC14465_13810 [alpha proteobacterium IMCC14465]|uniref:carbonic anhydrase n=1 Tax=alpha proteobacterium IMCC14465 TaxID=1220535 RepID=J9A5G0_9PROT|nr:hypothetical protein IMCC14465_13810 [alpha proteobacterium IMCC14465]